mgnify:CR=1 FL=1
MFSIFKFYKLLRIYINHIIQFYNSQNIQLNWDFNSYLPCQYNNLKETSNSFCIQLYCCRLESGAHLKRPRASC